MIRILVGDCRDHMAAMEPNCVDSIVTDPPYGLHFMGKSWDKFGGALGVDHKKTTERSGSMHAGTYDFGRNYEFQMSMTEWARAAYRVLKPGGFMLAFGGTRTFHRLTVAIEDAGFEIRDCLMWLYGSGFPKSLDVSKALDKAAGVEREVVGTRGLNSWANGASAGVAMKDDGGIRQDFEKVNALTAPATDLARQWDGWGTALKPAWEPIIMARKPLIGSVAANVTQYGTGGINVDGCRIETDEETGRKNINGPYQSERTWSVSKTPAADSTGHGLGRWPANVLLGCACEGEAHDPECAVALLDAQSGERKSPATYVRNADGFGKSSYQFGESAGTLSQNYGDTGGASRFMKVVQPDPLDGWYCCEDCNITRHISELTSGCPNCGETMVPADGSTCRQPDPLPIESGDELRFRYTAKAGRAERNKGLDGMPEHVTREYRTGNVHNMHGGRVPDKVSHNHHPTVKPLDLMQWLCRLVTPPGGTVLDPFMGSGSTLIAADREGFNGIGIELDAEYAEIARRRIAGDSPLFANVETT